MSITSWSRDGEPSVAEAEAKRLRKEIAVERLHAGVVGRLPLDRDLAAVELTEEERARRNSRPRTRRWRGLGKFDDKIDSLTQRRTEAFARLSEAEALLQRAPEDDARTLADWFAAGERGERPLATVYERERERDAAKILVDAVGLELDRELEARLAYVERHRERMLKDARRDVTEARDKLREHVRGLPELRDALLGARETLAWAATYPDSAPAYGFVSALALGLRAPVERTLHTTARVEYLAVLAALEGDADALASEYAQAVKQKLGTAGARTRSRKRCGTATPRWSSGRDKSSNGRANWPNGTTRTSSLRRFATDAGRHLLPEARSQRRCRPLS
jgi:hypothetical protein